VIHIFPNRDSALRLLGALLMEQDEAWTTGHRYFDMGAYWQWRRADVSSIEATSQPAQHLSWERPGSTDGLSGEREVAR
jgi:hypothetical protein